MSDRASLCGLAPTIPGLCTFVTPVFLTRDGNRVCQRFSADGRIEQFIPSDLCEFPRWKAAPHSRSTARLGGPAILAFEIQPDVFVVGTISEMRRELRIHLGTRTADSRSIGNATCATIQRFLEATAHIEPDSREDAFLSLFDAYAWESDPIDICAISPPDHATFPEREPLSGHGQSNLADLIDRLVNEGTDLWTNIDLSKPVLAELKQLGERLSAQADRVSPRHRDNGPGANQETLDRAAIDLDELTNDLTYLTHSLAELLSSKSGSPDQVDALALLRNKSKTRRLVPWNRVADDLRAVVENVATAQAKLVRLHLSGMNVETDDRIQDFMKGAIRELLFDCVTNGIETPIERLASGKTEHGNVLVDLSRRDDRLIVRISDDGRGCSLQEIEEQAASAGLELSGKCGFGDGAKFEIALGSNLSRTEVETVRDQRRAGIPKVVHAAMMLGANLKGFTRTSRGTSWFLDVPAHMSLRPVRIVQSTNKLYALPEQFVGDPLDEEDLKLLEFATMGGVCTIKGESHRVINLSRMLGDLRSSRQVNEAMENALIVRTPGGPVALAVDKILGTKNVIAPPLGLFEGDQQMIPLLLGMVALDSGDVVHVLNVKALARPDVHVNAGVSRRLSSEPLALVVDDSRTARIHAQRTLEGIGMRVMVAASEQEALGLVATHKPDIVLFDIEMPRMTGFDLVKTLRTKTAASDIPVVVIGTMRPEIGRARAYSQGATSYLEKPYAEHDLVSVALKYTQAKGDLSPSKKSRAGGDDVA